MAITSGGDARTQLPKNFKTTQKALSLPFSREVVILDHLLEVGGNGRTKKEEKRTILTRNNPFDFDGNLKNE